MTTLKEILAQIKEKEVKYVDVRFTDMRGKLQHVTFDIILVDEDFLTDGTMFDGSSIAGWKAINESRHEAAAGPGHRLHRSVLPADDAVPVLRRAEPRHQRALQPRPALDRQEGAEPTSSPSGVGDTVYFGPEAEFFIFDDVRWSTAPNNTGYSFDSRRAAGQHRQGLSRRQHGPPARAQGRLLPGQPDRLRPGPARRDAGGDGRAGHRAGEAPPRGGAGPARAGPEVRRPDHHGRPPAALQVRHPQRRRRLRQDRHLHGQADVRRQRLGHARATSRSGTRASRCSPATSTPASRRPASSTSAASSSTPRRSTPSPTPPPTPTSAWCPATKPR